MLFRSSRIMTTGELAAAAADAYGAHQKGLSTSANVASFGAAVAAGAAVIASTGFFGAFVRGIGIGTAPAAAVTQATMSLVSLKTAESSAERFAASLGLLAGVSGVLATILPPSPVKVAMLALSITATAAQALVLANQPLGQDLLDALDAGNQALSRFFYTQPGERPLDHIERQTQTASTYPSPIILDLDGIDTGRELFGSETRLANDTFGARFDKETGAPEALKSLLKGERWRLRGGTRCANCEAWRDAA